jgi:hypothetical protein
MGEGSADAGIVDSSLGQQLPSKDLHSVNGGGNNKTASNIISLKGTLANESIYVI